MQPILVAVWVCPHYAMTQDVRSEQESRLSVVQTSERRVRRIKGRAKAHMVPGRKDAGAQARHEEVEQVEHLLRRPPVLRHAQLDADLRGGSDTASASAENAGFGGGRLACEL